MENIILVRSINANTKEENRFYFIIEDDENGYPSVIKDLQGNASHAEHLQAIVDFLNFAKLYLETRGDYNLKKDIDDEWDNYTLVFSFNKALPFFGFYDIKVKGFSESRYTLLQSGRLTSGNLNAFFSIDPENRNHRNVQRQVPQIPRRNEKTVTQNGVNISLDDNWQYNDTTELPGYWLALGSIRDSQIAVEKFKLAAFNVTKENFFRILKLDILIEGNAIEIETVKTDEISGGYQIEYYLNDGLMRNYKRLRIILKGDELIVINFSTFADIFDNNKSYYERILNSVLVNR
jgi:hypothetical protein